MINLKGFKDPKGLDVYLNVTEVESVCTDADRSGFILTKINMKSGQSILVKEKLDAVLLKLMKANGPGSSIT